MNWLLLASALDLGLIYGLAALGVYLTFKVIQFADLTVDGSFSLGACTCASLIVSGVNPWMASALATLAGGLSGYITGTLHTKAKIFDILCGILTMTALYSINLRIMGRPNLALLNEASIFPDAIPSALFLFMIVAVIAWGLWLFLSSEIGLAMRSSGTSPAASAALGIDVLSMKRIGLSISNALVALSGALFCQRYGFADISMGTGTLVIGLASVIVGHSLLSSMRLKWVLISILLGSMVYRLAITCALSMPEIGSIIKLEPSDLNLITVILVVIAMLPVFKTRKWL